MPSPELDQARALLARLPLIDGHNDMPYVIWHDQDARGDVLKWNAARVHPESDTDIPRLREGLVGTQILTAYIPTMTPDPLRARLEVIDVMLQLEQRHADAFHPVLSPNDVASAKSAGKIGLFKAVEGLVGVDRVGHLRLFHAMGIRLITLCHNETLPFVDSATDHPGKEPLSSLGREIIAEMERLGLIIDLAHVSPAAQHAVMDCAKGPVIISHANARALCNHPRNAPDDVMKRIAKGGGMVMATFVPAFLAQGAYDALKPAMDGLGKAADNANPEIYVAAKRKAFALYAERDGIEYFCDHLDYMRNLIGDDAIGIGSDFYGGLNPPGLEDCTRFPHLISALIKRGWSTTSLEKLCHNNFMRVWRNVYQPDPTL